MNIHHNEGLTTMKKEPKPNSNLGQVLRALRYTGTVTSAERLAELTGLSRKQVMDAASHLSRGYPRLVQLARRPDGTHLNRLYTLAVTAPSAAGPRPVAGLIPPLAVSTPRRLPAPRPGGSLDDLLAQHAELRGLVDTLELRLSVLEQHTYSGVRSIPRTSATG